MGGTARDEVFVLRSQAAKSLAHCDMSASEHRGQGGSLFPQFHFLPITVGWQEVQGAEKCVLRQKTWDPAWLCMQI